MYFLVYYTLLVAAIVISTLYKYYVINLGGINYAFNEIKHTDYVQKA